jgi:hypothetical protein
MNHPQGYESGSATPFGQRFGCPNHSQCSKPKHPQGQRDGSATPIIWLPRGGGRQPPCFFLFHFYFLKTFLFYYFLYLVFFVFCFIYLFICYFFFMRNTFHFIIGAEVVVFVKIPNGSWERRVICYFCLRLGATHLKIL